MLEIRIDLFVHQQDERRLEQKLDNLTDLVTALSTDPKLLADLASKLTKPTADVNAAINANPIPTTP
jgi:hypothetical protein